MPGATLSNPRRLVRLENSFAPGASLCSQARLQPQRPRAAQKNPHVCVLNLAGSVSGHEAFTNPQVDGP